MKNKKEYIFLFICFILLTPSFYCNLWNIAPDKKFKEFDAFSEAMVMGKITKSRVDGLFSHAGFTGAYYHSSLDKDNIPLYTLSQHKRDSIINTNLYHQLEYYYGEKEVPNAYCPYLTHGGGQAQFYSIIDAVLPFTPYVNYNLMRLINALLVALCFCLFLGWVYRNYGIVASSITLAFILFSPWLILFCGRNGLWWSLWSFFTPFLSMLLLLEKRAYFVNHMWKIYVLVFLSVLVKCIFTGYEFITTSLLAIYFPVVYYFYLDKAKFRDFILFSFKVGVIALVSVFLYSLILMIQMKGVMGDFTHAWQYLFDSYERRTIYGISRWEILDTYFKGNAFNLGLISINNFYFCYLFFITIAFSVILYLVGRGQKQIREYKALLITSFLSIASPLSWIIIFKEHAFGHTHLDFIIWYMPFLLYCFVIIGASISLLMSKLITNCIRNDYSSK